MRRTTALAAAAFAVLAFAGCSADTKDFKVQGEQYLEGDEVRERFGMVRMSDAECQEPADTNKDTTYTCTATGSDGNTWGFTIEIAGSKLLRVIQGAVVTLDTPTESSVPVESNTPADSSATTTTSGASTTTAATTASAVTTTAGATTTTAPA